MKDFGKDVWRWLRTVSREQWMQAVIGVWCLMVSALLLTQSGAYTETNFTQNVSWLTLIGGMMLGLLVLAVLGRWYPQLHAESRVFLFGVLLTVFLLAIRATAYSRMYIFYGTALVALLLLYYAASRGMLSFSRLRPGNLTIAVAVGALFVAMATLIALIGILRYYTFRTPNFDFGIFSQMFHSMSENLSQNTTCERNELLSHFAVHISPIYYLMLPAYMVFPSPVTLLVGQSIVVASGLLPLCLLAKRHSLSGKQMLLLALVYAAYPALSCGCQYDLHENCFLIPLLLWVFYFYEEGKKWPLVIAVALTLFVKEDAAVYIGLFGLYAAVSRHELRRGLLLIITAAAYFIIAIILLSQFGDGAMLGRYNTLQYEGGGLFGIIKTLVSNPGLVLSTMFQPFGGNATTRLRYIAQMVVPLGLALFSTRRLSRYLLLLPILLNLLASSQYQGNLMFQYNFGVSAFFLYLCLLNLADSEPVRQKWHLSYMAVATVLLYTVLFVPTLKSNVAIYRENAAVCRRMEEALTLIPDEESVTCSTFLLPHLSKRDVLYETLYHAEIDTAYLALDLRTAYADSDAEKLVQRYSEAGYETVFYEEEVLIIMRCADTNA